MTEKIPNEIAKEDLDYYITQVEILVEYVMSIDDRLNDCEEVVKKLLPVK